MRVRQSFHLSAMALFFLVGTVLAWAAPALVSAFDCSQCQEIANEAKTITDESQRTNQLLESNKRALASVGQNEISKKVKISSNILVLSTRLETMANKKQVIHQQLQSPNCRNCPGVRH